MPYDILINLKRWNQYRKRQLLHEHSILHSWWLSIKSGKKLKAKTGEEISKSKIIEMHKEIVKRLISLGFNHYIRDDLDLTLPKYLLKVSKKVE